MQSAIPFFRRMIQKTFTPRLKVITGTFVVLLAGSVGLSAPTADKGLPPNVSSRLLAVLDALEVPRGQETTPQRIDPLAGARIDEMGRLEVMISTAETTAQARKELEARGCSIEIYDSAQNLVQAWIAPEHVRELAGLSFVKFVDLPNYGVTNQPPDE